METTIETNLLETAVEAARAAGRVLLEHRRRGFSIAKKGRVNLVTEADLASERLIVERIHGRFPTHRVLAEEGGNGGGEAEFRWVIDPLDGTTNYAHGYPCFCVSIGVERQDELVVGVVFDPLRRELFTARRGYGAFLNGRPIHVSMEERLEDSLLCTGFSYQEDEIAGNLKLFSAVMMAARSVRRDGSAALDLCYVACGRFDGFWELSLNPWDVAAGMLILREAGGKVTRFDGTPGTIHDRECLATNGRIHEPLAAILRGESGVGKQDTGGSRTGH
jgi:myo-inositol-1(or 4)-monophosphatase